MKENKNPNEELMREKLEELEATPKENNWQNISDALEGEALDAFAKMKLDEFEVKPSPKIWKHVKKELPLSLLVRNKLNWLARIAAVLVIFMVASLWIRSDFFPTESPVAENVSPLQTTTTDQTPSGDFVFSPGAKSHKKSPSASKELLLDDQETFETLWDFVMEKEDLHFLAEVDDEVIAKSLEPLLQLPIENLEAAISPKIRWVAKNNLDKNFVKNLGNILIQYHISPFIRNRPAIQQESETPSP